MLKSKTIDRVAAAGITLAAAFCLLAMVFSNAIAEAFGGAGVSMEYETELFDTSKIIEIDIAMDEDDWAETPLLLPALPVLQTDPAVFALHKAVLALQRKLHRRLIVFWPDL